VTAKVGKDAADRVAAGYGIDDFDAAELEPSKSAFPTIDWQALWGTKRRKSGSLLATHKVHSLQTLESATSLPTGSRA